ncbi:MAG: hypothetical protein PHE12_01975 [Clostridia bacterium]|nr:hypothetical protein [Clostridia bacterium]
MYNDSTLKALIENAKKSAELQKKQSKKEQNLLEEFAEIDQKYGAGKSAEYALPTDAELEAAAKQAYAELHSKGKEDIADKTAKAYQELEGSKEAQKLRLFDRLEQIDSAFKEKERQLKGRAIKQGIARSSIFEGAAELLGSEKQAEQSAADSDYFSVIRQTDQKIAALQQQMQDALADLNQSYAEKISKKLEKLISQREKQLQQYLKQQKKDDESTKAFRQEEKLAAAKRYYDKMPAQKAIEHISANEKIKEHLGSYYNYFVNYLRRKI